MEALRKILSVKEGKGPSPTFTEPQLVYLIFLIGSEPYIGRKRLKELLQLGEGSVRTMVSRLMKRGLAVSTRGGVALTEKGEEVYERLKKLVSPLRKISFKMPWEAPANYGLVVKGLAERISTGLEERDEAVRHGASAAMVLTFLSDGVHMPRVSNLSVERPEFAEQVKSFFKPEVGDVIIITGAEDEPRAMYSALAAALKILLGKR
ncbi:conserved hypothetical protein [Candidatus Caldarchaeum subterraneum]|uniref:Uncharacterized protein n=1 Tax=Caldiarchaeum subterraneum TaxID=311458 RepID=E6N5L5_CALS0|nr:conserved hypothetical protein [Candidatus Caldarchaeum subterraneum]BAJ50370.1 conserved hypothetical protein [Candidatus Caldarchaeum subterraneum]